MARGKFRKPQRGGGHHFTRNLGQRSEGTQRDNSGAWGENPDDEDSESEEEESENTRNTDKFGENSTPILEIGSLQISKPQISDSDDESDEDGGSQRVKSGSGTSSVNPNRMPQRPTKASNINADAPPRMSRREREQAEKAAAKERYWKLHEQGKTDEAKADLARLAKIKAQREAAAAARKADAEEKAAAAKARLEISGKRR